MTSVTTEDSTPGSDLSGAPASPAAEPATAQRVWKMPSPPAHHVDQAGRAARTALAGVGTALAASARFVGRIATGTWRAIEAVPASLQIFGVALLALLFGLAGALAGTGTLSLICTVVVLPLSALVLGALGQQWHSGPRSVSGDRPSASSSDLQRSVEYVDKKLAVALTSFGTDRHQQAVIALFQAKTAVELTLGTEQDGAGVIELPGDEQTPRPRIRVGSVSKSLLRESDSMAAS
ncbi:hypothetical protein BCA37_25205 [Mycobacterium sp. djl-10]|nr:hypothetical protein BCA37_25205 [Mycobacterium sp. djl-10]